MSAVPRPAAAARPTPSSAHLVMQPGGHGVRAALHRQLNRAAVSQLAGSADERIAAHRCHAWRPAINPLPGHEEKARAQGLQGKALDGGRFVAD